MSILKKGMKGAPVKRLQEKLGVGADGDFGPGTQKAVMDFQKANGLSVDGIAGPDTFTAMGLDELVLLRVGSRGEQVKKLQAALGASADGIFGSGTKQAVMDYQKANGLAVDGMAGPSTLATMDAFDTMDASVVSRAEITPEEEAAFDGEDLPEISGSDAVQGSAGEVAPKKSLWGKVKGWFG
ncbi:peptidoglycan-binding protein [Ahrensia sp. R2A130]|uniref:peptidoglycan-binding domain-containing protein n=1 Tax=Ahrensia sp. R2A130 TaxID=744979 RepID=UPI0001E0F0CA|nr:peptidoglycan-binding protein [Ahrensia sp. R2A130]EFL89183.1 peptidoglycan binding domain-containing protein [Ahrensia sp. R2A130]